MIVICCALYFEAKPVITALDLRRCNENRFVEEYANEDNTIRLIITGVGEVKAASSCSAELTYLSLLYPKTTIHLVNVGICAGREDVKGELFVINKITEQNTGRDFYPDMLYRVNLKEMPIICSSKPVKDIESDFVYDMESSGIFTSGSSLLSPDRITILKVVSDSGDFEEVTPKVIKRTIEGKIDQIKDVILLLQTTTIGENNKIDSDKFEKACNRLCLTTAMQNNFKQLLKYASLTGKNTDDILDKMPEVTSKKQGKEILDELRNELI